MACAAILCQSKCVLTIWLTNVLGVIFLVSHTLHNRFKFSLGIRRVTQLVDFLGNVIDFKADKITTFASYLSIRVALVDWRCDASKTIAIMNKLYQL